MTGRRDREVERLLTDLFASRARRVYGTDPGDFSDRVKRRLELGQSRYGDSWRSPRWDDLAELREELEDTAAYLLLEVQRLDAAGQIDTATFRAIIAAGAHVVSADHHARQAIRLRADAPPTG